MDERVANVIAGESAGKTPVEQPVTHWQESIVTRHGLEDRSNVFFAAIEMTRMPMVLADPNLPDCPIVFVNRAFEELTGYAEDEILGRNCRFLQGAQTDRERILEMRAAMAAQSAVSVEILNYRRDGTPFWNALFIAPVHASDGRLLFYFASQLDITRRRVSEESFRQAQKMESIGQLTAGLGHDFNNLLQVINGNLEMLGNRLESPELRRYVDKARDAADRGSKLTKQLLAFARKTRLDTKVVDLNALITGFAELLESTLGEHGELEFQFRRRLPLVEVDPAHLEMALLNVVINARDASPQGSVVRIATSSIVEDEDGREQRYVVLSVIDEGSGMPDYVRQRAVEPFFTTKPTGTGTGLGLAMVHGFVQQSMGRLRIDSEADRGTTIRMLFPIAKDTPRSPPIDPFPRAAQQTARLEPEAILLVEDNDDVLTLALEHLTALGYEVLTARNADDALAILGRHGQRIDLLFSDILMPGSMNGIMLAEHVQREFPGMSILLATGYNEELVVDGPTAASLDVLGKPYRRSELSDRVRAALNRKADSLRAERVPRPFTGPVHEA